MNRVLLLARQIPSKLSNILHRNDAIVAGGYIRDWFAGSEAKDMDIFCERPAELQKQLLDAGAKLLAKTDNAATYEYTGRILQVITRWRFKDAKDCIAHFDFTVCAAAVQFQTDGLYGFHHHPDFFVDLAGRRLRLVTPGTDEPAASLTRMIKFIERGYKIAAPDLARLLRRVMSKHHNDDLERLVAALAEIDVLNVEIHGAE